MHDLSSATFIAQLELGFAVSWPGFDRRCDGIRALIGNDRSAVPLLKRGALLDALRPIMFANDQCLLIFS
jgi:hypothetical protein